jgi:hypothetical protein
LDAGVREKVLGKLHEFSKGAILTIHWMYSNCLAVFMEVQVYPKYNVSVTRIV